MAIPCDPGGTVKIDDVVAGVNTNEMNISNNLTAIQQNTSDIQTKEDSLGLGTAGQVLATNQAADGKEWIDMSGSDADTLDGIDSTGFVQNTETGTSPVSKVVTCTQADYDALTPVADTLYIIVG